MRHGYVYWATKRIKLGQVTEGMPQEPSERPHGLRPDRGGQAREETRKNNQGFRDLYFSDLKPGTRP